MHDIGKITVPEELLNKPGKLEKHEMDKIKEHCVSGFRILSSAPEFERIAGYIYQHHEHYDGNGYPQLLKGEEIYIQSRIICIADAYDAMTNDRPYRAKLSKNESINILKENAGTHFDPNIIDVIIKDPHILFDV